MVAPTPIRISQEDFNHLLTLSENQNRQLELWDGLIIETMPSRLHAFIQNLFAALFFNYLQTHPIGYSYTEFRIEIEGEDYAPIPDVAVVMKERGETDWHSSLPFMPDLVVEIQSPNQSDKFMLDKANYYLQHGCQMIIIVYTKGIVEVFTPTKRDLLTPADTLDFSEVLPDLSIPVASIFPPTAIR